MTVGARRYPLPFFGRRATVVSLPDWLRMTGLLLTRLTAPYAAAITAGRRGRIRDLHEAERRWASRALAGSRTRVVASGMQHVDPGERYVVAPLHEGLADPLVLQLLGLDLVFAVRDELFDWPYLGRYLRAAGHLDIVPEQGRAAYRTILRRAGEVFSRGESLVVFPQGSILGVEIAFRAGAFHLARRLGRPVLPVVIAGTHRVWHHPFDSTVETGRMIRLAVLPPVDPADAVAAADRLERRMKSLALAMPDVRRFVPRRDGWWDGYRYEIDPAFPELAAAVAAHRAERLQAVR